MLLDPRPLPLSLIATQAWNELPEDATLTEALVTGGEVDAVWWTTVDGGGGGVVGTVTVVGTVVTASLVLVTTGSVLRSTIGFAEGADWLL
jgi:hypothetical protein